MNYNLIIVHKKENTNMKKTILTILLFVVVFLTLTGCNDKKEDNGKENDIFSFKATIIECEEKSMIVKPDEDESISNSASAVRVEFVNGYNSCKVNDRVKVTYEGYINESYPVQIGTTKIESIK